MPAPSLILFDCDGVLVDSEIIASQLEAQLLTEAGFPIEAEEMSERFAGLTWTDILLEVERQASIPLSATMVDRMEKELDDKLKNEVLIIDDVAAAVDALGIAKAICSNSKSYRLELMLKRVGLYDVFAPHIYSAREVGTQKAKPDPNVYLFAAEKFGVAPKDVIVVEDSAPGVRAAVAAGMRVIGFTGGSHTYMGHAEVLTDAGATTVIHRHRDLPATIEALSVWADA